LIRAGDNEPPKAEALDDRGVGMFVSMMLAQDAIILRDQRVDIRQGCSVGMFMPPHGDEDNVIAKLVIQIALEGGDDEHLSIKTRVIGPDSTDVVHPFFRMTAVELPRLFPLSRNLHYALKLDATRFGWRLMASARQPAELEWQIDFSVGFSVVGA
jgi:hypothetical protein